MTNKDNPPSQSPGSEETMGLMAGVMLFLVSAWIMVGVLAVIVLVVY